MPNGYIYIITIHRVPLLFIDFFFYPCLWKMAWVLGKAIAICTKMCDLFAIGNYYWKFWGKIITNHFMHLIQSESSLYVLIRWTILFDISFGILQSALWPIRIHHHVRLTMLFICGKCCNVCVCVVDHNINRFDGLYSPFMGRKLRWQWW